MRISRENIQSRLAAVRIGGDGRFSTVMIFDDRIQAGRLLAEALLQLEVEPPLAQRRDVLVLAIPRGGVVIGAEVARMLDAPLNVWLAHKIGAPGNPEFAIGSVATNGEVLLDQASIRALGISTDYLDQAVARERRELLARMERLTGKGEPVDVAGKTVVLVDDGVATGSTALSALASLHRAGAAERILAVPVAPQDQMERLQAAAERVVVLSAPSFFMAVGQFYREFAQVSDEEVKRLLAAE